jgi:hypothetical protein
MEQLLAIVGFNRKGIVPHSRLKVQAAIEYVLAHSFIPADANWRHSRWDRTIDKAQRSYRFKARAD